MPSPGCVPSTPNRLHMRRIIFCFRLCLVWRCMALERRVSTREERCYLLRVSRDECFWMLSSSGLDGLFCAYSSISFQQSSLFERFTRQVLFCPGLLCTVFRNTGLIMFVVLKQFHFLVCSNCLSNLAVVTVKKIGGYCCCLFWVGLMVILCEGLGAGRRRE